MKVCSGSVVTSFVRFFFFGFPDWQDNGKGCCCGGGGGSEKVELSVQVIFHGVQDNHRVVRAREQARHIFLEIKVKTTQRKVEIQFQKHSQLSETY